MATIKQKLAAKKIVENHGVVSTAMIEVGYAPATAKNPKNLTESNGWQELMDTYLADEDLAKKHQELLLASRIEHMVFPLNVTDEQIIDLLAEVNCKARRFMHSDTQTHVWFWSADNKARQSALDMAYKLKGSYAAEKSINLNLEATIDEEGLEAITESLNNQMKNVYQGTGTWQDLPKDTN